MSGEDGRPPSVSLGSLRQMDDERFEQFVADLWAEMGYRTVVRQFSNDGGIDVVASKRGPAGAAKTIQAKRYASTSVGGPDVQQYFAMKHQEGADKGLIVTTGTFTDPAKDRAAELGVGLIDGRNLVTLVRRHGSVSFYWRYRTALGIDEAAIAEWVAARESRPASERVRRTVANALGAAETRAGRVLAEAGGAFADLGSVARRAGTRLRGYAPIIVTQSDTEQKDTSRRRADDDHAGTDAWAARLERRGRALVDRGVDRRELPLVRWTLSVRSIVPLTGVSPSLRANRSGVDRWWVLAAVGTVALLVALFTPWTSLPVSRGVPLGGLVAVGGATVGLVGVVGSTATDSRTLVDAARAAYALPLVALLVGHGTLQARYPPLGAREVALVGLGAFLAHSVFAGRVSPRPTQTWTVGSEAPSYSPVHAPGTVLGLVGSVTVAAVLGVELAGASCTAVGLTEPVCATLLTGAGVVVVVDTAVRATRGGVVGIAAGAVLVGYVLLFGHVLGVFPARLVFGSDVLMAATLAAAGTIGLLAWRSPHRSLRPSVVLAATAGVVPLGIAYVTLRASGVSQRLSVVRPDTLGHAAVAVAVALYLCVAAVERRAVADLNTPDDP